MEQRKVFLNENKSVKATNETTNVSVNFDTNVRLLPYSDINEKLSLYKLYTDERDSCEKYRMIFTINPLCTNVLYNVISEIVRNEGSSACTCLNISQQPAPPDAVGVDSSQGRYITQQIAIRDSEYTHKDLFKFLGNQEQTFKTHEPYVYHCGVDIFNNHLLRGKEFSYVSYSNNKYVSFNTIGDFMRDRNGNIIREKINVNDTLETDMHLYRYDSIFSMYDAYRNKLNEENGWYGFTNPGNIEIPNIKISGGTFISVNRLMNNNKACEFIDLYPDRSLFSFVPKVNKFRNRLEYNWDYDIMYPCESDMNMLNLVCGISDGQRESSGGGSIRIIRAEETHTNNSTKLVRFKSLLRTTLKNGDYIRLYYSITNEGDESPVTDFTRFSTKIKIVQCGDEYGMNKNRYFSINYRDIELYFDFDEEGILRPRNGIELDRTKIVKFFYKKEVNGYECKYYFRKFAKINANGLESEINKLAYGENIYGDRMAQIVFTDDIDVGGLTDNLNMPIRELYIVFFKTNRGYKEWYYSGNTSGDTVEFSHCFGKLTSGLDLPSDSDCIDYNVRRLHNVNLSGNSVSELTKTLFKSCEKIPAVIEDDITKDNEMIYGDVVEFDRTTFKETPIENVYHRFNTKQRELTEKTNGNDCFRDVWDDEIKFDDYDKGVNSECANGFAIQSSRLNMIDNVAYRGNLAPEGYYYNPKTAIKIRELSDNIEEATTKIIKYEKFPQNTRLNPVYISITGVTTNPASGITNEEGDLARYWSLTVTASTKYDWVIGDSVYFYDSMNFDTIFGTVVAYDGNNIITVVVDENTLNVGKLIDGYYTMVTTREAIPIYAVFNPNSRKFIWRKPLKLSELTSDNELYNMPFSNGCLYIHKNINFFLKRQDPRNEYGLLYPEAEDTQIKSYRKAGWNEFDTSEIQYIRDDFNNICY